MFGEPGVNICTTPAEQTGAGDVKPWWNSHRVEAEVFFDCLRAAAEQLREFAKVQQVRHGIHSKR
jgi:hypothetical protein